MSKFPPDETFQDFSGNSVIFKYYIHKQPGIVTIYAEEVSDSATARHYKMYDGSSEHMAWLRLRELIRQELNTKYFSSSSEDPFEMMNYDYFRGIISQNENDDSPCFIVDGKLMTADNLLELLSAHVGHRFEIRLSE